MKNNRKYFRYVLLFVSKGKVKRQLTWALGAHYARIQALKIEQIKGWTFVAALTKDAFKKGRKDGAGQ